MKLFTNPIFTPTFYLYFATNEDQGTRFDEKGNFRNTLTFKYSNNLWL